MAEEVNEALADHIYGLEKEIKSDWRWRSNPRGMVGTANVNCKRDNYRLKLLGVRSSTIPGNFLFSLNYQGSIEIRRWEPEGSHENPNGEVVRGSHKHKWTSSGQADKVYQVNDVDTSSVYQAFKDFCKECRIEFKGTYQSSLENGKL